MARPPATLSTSAQRMPSPPEPTALLAAWEAGTASAEITLAA
jgi:hypothetical protein